MNSQIIKPKILKKGDFVGVVSPSSGIAKLIPHKLKLAEKSLNQMDFKVVFSKHALEKKDYVSASPKKRANDINEMFRDPKIKMIMAMIGGDHSNQILKFLDFKLIKNNPKIFIGYSDISVLHFAFYTQSNLITFYGPAFITQFGEFPEIINYTKEYFLKAVFSKTAIGNIEPSRIWTDELLNWFNKTDLKRPRKMKKSNGYEWWKKGKAEGIILGGCIPSINHLLGTKYWPDFDKKILFIDIPEGNDWGRGLPVAELDSFLADLDNAQLFQKIKGLIIGRPYGYKELEIKKLKEIILKLTEKYNYPILFNVNIGHTDPIATIPLGLMAKMESSKNSFQILESGIIDK